MPHPMRLTGASVLLPSIEVLMAPTAPNRRAVRNRRPTDASARPVAWFPQLSLFPVNPNVLAPFTVFSTGMTAIAGIPKGLGELVKAGVASGPLSSAAQNLEPVLHILGPALLYAVLGTLLVVAVRVRLLDRIAIFSLAKAFLVVSLLYVCCAVLILLGTDMGYFAKAVILAVLTVGIAGGVLGGVLPYAWRKRFYGDVVVELAILSVLVVLSVPPITHVFSYEP